VLREIVAPFFIQIKTKMSRIIDIQKKSNQYMAAFKDNVIRVIESNEKIMLNMNKSQMLGSFDAMDKSLIHSRTKSEYLSKPYARRKGKSKPNLFDRGDFQGGMFMTMPTEKDYIITSDDPKVNFLIGNYGSIFGVSPKNQPKAKEVNDKSIVEDYFKNVFQ